MFGDLMYGIYTAISWILLRWHDLWSFLGVGKFLGTNWDWILAIVFLVITVRIILFPIFVKQIRSQRAMQALQPKVKELQAKHKGDQQTLREEMMKLYQTEKVNPLMGCLPMFLQIPVFLGLFHVLRRLDPVQSVNTTIYTWTQAQWDSAARARLFDAPIPAHFASDANELLTLSGSGLTVKIVAGVLVLIMMATTFMTSRQMILKTGWSADPQQRMIQRLMLYGIPISLLLSGWYFPIGVIIYWVTQNLFSLGQQYWVLHKYPPPISEGSTPLKPGKGGAPAQTAKRGLLARLLPGSKSTASDAPRTRVFRRKAEVTETPAVTETRSLAPRPGAKPVQRRPAAPKAPDKPADTSSGGSSSGGSSSGGPSVGEGPTIGRLPTGGDNEASSNGNGTAPADAPAPASGAGAGKGPAANPGKGPARTAVKATPSTRAPAKSTPKAAPAAGATNPSATANGSSNGASSSARSGGSGTTGAKKATPRKGPVKKKGGRKR
jgi:YidC/Oxa1 family membrane protein insertase